MTDTHGPPSLWDGDGAGSGVGGRWLGLGLPHPCVFDSLFPSVGLLPVEDKEGT